MNILIISRELPPVGGGAGHVALHLAETLASEGHNLSLITMHFGDLPYFEQRGRLSIYRVRCGRKHRDSSYVIEMLRFLIVGQSVAKKIARDEQTQIIHAHAIVPDGIIAWVLHRHLRRPFVITAHGSDVPGYNPDQFRFAHALITPLWKRVVDAAAALVTPSSHLGRLIRITRPSRSTQTIANGISNKFCQTRERNSGFLIVSRLVQRKNYHIFLKALGHVREPQVVNIVGEGPMMAELKAIANNLPQHEVIFHGWLDNESDEWRALYESNQFFVLPSASENFPISLLEAGLAGLAILTTKLPGHIELLGDDAVYFESTDESEISRTLSDVLSKGSEDWDGMTDRLKNRIANRYSWHQIATQYTELYLSIITAGSTTPKNPKSLV